MKRLEGKVALITGASRGLGRAVALAFAREGAALAICARGREALSAVAAQCRSEGVEVLDLVADMQSAGDRERLAVLALDQFGRIDILVNNASELGPLPRPYLIDYPPDAFERVLRVNVIAPYHLAWSVLGGMLQRGEGVVINVSSDVAVNGYPGWGAYAVSKAALDGLTRTWASEVENSGVRIYSVDPGDMDTAMHRAALPEDDPASLARPEDVAEAFIQLAINGADSDRVSAAELIPVVASA
jgi:NAD(P)-dependent dehydrogenase (short-subunit alcohol dehydrogenase family)